MKRITILSMMAILFCQLSFAQEETNYFQMKNEINVQVDDIFAKQGMLDYYYYNLDYNYDYPIYYYNDQMNAPAIGIGYKHHFSKSAIRLKGSLSIFTRNFENNKDNDSDDVFIGIYNERVSAGYELHQNWGRTQIFFGLDAVIGLQTNVSKQKMITTDYNGNTIQELDGKYIAANFSYGLQPFLGFKYMINPKFSVSTEYHILMERFVSNSKVKIEGRDDEEGSKTIGFTTQFGPKGQITFSYHF